MICYEDLKIEREIEQEEERYFQKYENTDEENHL